MTHEKAIQELELKIQGELMQGNTPLVEIYELAIEAFKKLERIERIINAPEYMPQEVQIRYYAICEVLKGAEKSESVRNCPKLSEPEQPKPWILKNGLFVCPYCKEYTDTHFNFCPWCGKKVI